ncbi:MAG: hypothetical protein E6J18_05205 [Chloroflexi bacterium]|nr:MAG: hypothetical protein E6J18_05205 [Chloroflexota bacterium]
MAAFSRALKRRLTLRAAGVPFRSSPFTCLRADPMGSDATWATVLAAPKATSSTVVAVSPAVSAI